MRSPFFRWTTFNELDGLGVAPLGFGSGRRDEHQHSECEWRESRETCELAKHSVPSVWAGPRAATNIFLEPPFSPGTGDL